jgi:hypothetical protein
MARFILRGVYTNACDFGLIEATDEQHARDLAAQMVGYQSEADMIEQLRKPSGIVVEKTG